MPGSCPISLIPKRGGQGRSRRADCGPGQHDQSGCGTFPQCHAGIRPGNAGGRRQAHLDRFRHIRCGNASGTSGTQPPYRRCHHHRGLQGGAVPSRKDAQGCAKQVGKIYYFSPGKLEIKNGDHVIVETARGIEYGHVVLGNRDVEDNKVVQPLKAVIRMANKEDIAREEANRKKEKDAFKICQEKIRKHKLEMKLIDVEYTFDNNKILFYFTADGRIDFRELVKDLASVFKTRIELRQVGVRDETKIIGGVGICGRALCCHSYLSEFIPVSIKMAKEQNLSLNPTKISGVCGRLMCCLKNEEETYEYLNSKLPGVGDYVTTDDGLKGEVQSVNVLRQLVKVIVTVEKDEKEIREYKVEQLKFKPRRRKGKNEQPEDHELKKLEALEKKEGKSKLNE